MARRASKTKSAATVDANTRILLLTGAEDMLKREHLQELRAALAAAHGEIQPVEFDGKTVELAVVLDELRTFSLMQQHKLVIVDEADQFVRETTRPALERYAQGPVDHATLVLRSTKWNKGRLDTLIEKVGAKIKCDPRSAAEARTWLVQRSDEVHKRKLDPQAAEAMVRRLGVDLGKLDGELAKLALLVEPKQAIDAKLVDEVVGRSSEEEAWQVQEALLEALVGESAGSGRPPDREGPGGRVGNLPGRTSGGGGRGGGAIEKIHELVDLAGQPDVLVLYFVADLVRKLWLAATMKQQGVSDFQIGRELKLWGPRQNLFLALLRRLGRGGAAKAFNRIVTADARSKSGFGEAVTNLECFCVQLADQLQ